MQIRDFNLIAHLMIQLKIIHKIVLMLARKINL